MFRLSVLVSQAVTESLFFVRDSLIEITSFYWILTLDSQAFCFGCKKLRFPFDYVEEIAVTLLTCLYITTLLEVCQAFFWNSLKNRFFFFCLTRRRKENQLSCLTYSFVVVRLQEDFSSWLESSIPYAKWFVKWFFENFFRKFLSNRTEYRQRLQRQCI